MVERIQTPTTNQNRRVLPFWSRKDRKDSVLVQEEKGFLARTWHTLLYVVAVNLLLIVYLIMWHGDPQKQGLVYTFSAISAPVTMILFVMFGLAATERGRLLPFGAFPRNFTLIGSVPLGLVGAVAMIFISAFLSKYSGGMALVAMPELIEALSGLFRWPFPKLKISPVLLDWTDSVAAAGWQGVVSGVEEGMNVAFTLALAYCLFMVLKRKRRGQGEELGDWAKRGILALSSLVVGFIWVGLHGFQSYHSVSEFGSAFAGRLIMAATTFLTGSVFPAFFMHLFYNILAPSITIAIVSLLPQVALFLLPILVIRKRL